MARRLGVGQRSGASSTIVEVNSGRRYRLSRWPWLVVVAALTYVALATADLRLGPVPLKAVVTAAAVSAWALEARRHGVPRPPWTGPVLVFGIGVPLIWLAIAVLRDHFGDPAYPAGLSGAFEQASRFFYVLLYFPLADWYRERRDDSAHRIWLWPIYALCALTWLLFLGYLFVGVDYGDTLNSGPVRGDISVSASGAFRVFFVNQIGLIPAAALLLARIRFADLDPARFAGASLVLGTVYLSHTRGIWLGILVATATVLLAGIVGQRPLRPAAIAGIGIMLALAFAVNAVPTLARPLVVEVTGGERELSTSSRFEQAPRLLDEIQLRPAFGSGLGATLPSGYVRSIATPWSYELSWLQLLFQIGFAGVACVALAPLLATRAVWRRIPDLDPAARIAPVAGLAGLVGFLLTCGSNPFLMTSIGTATLAILLSLCGTCKREA